MIIPKHLHYLIYKRQLLNHDLTLSKTRPIYFSIHVNVF